VLKLLGRKTSGNVQKVMWLLEELGLPHEREDYGRLFNNTQTAAYLKLNPTAKVPTLVDGDTVIWESNSILRYLAAKAGNRFYPADLAARSHVERWMDWQLDALNRPYLAVFRETRNPPEKRSAELPAHAKAMADELLIIEGALGESGWLAGADMTIAEICLGPIVHRCLNFGVELPALPKVKRWDERYSSRPAFKKAVAG
jgi:glutathione S-transferase